MTTPGGAGLQPLFSAGELEKRVIELAAEVDADHAQAADLVVVGILKGAFIFMADLCRRLSVSHSVDFMAVSSYGSTTTQGAVRVLLDTRTDLAGKNVLIVEDIVDSGRTLAQLRALLLARHPMSLRTCALLSKPDRRRVDVPVEYIGFSISDVWVVGYGLDVGERYRTLPYIAGLADPAGPAGTLPGQRAE